MSIPYVRKYYQMPWLKRGVRVQTPRGPGRVTSATCHVHVFLDAGYGTIWHPNDVTQIKLTDGALVRTEEGT